MYLHMSTAPLFLVHPEYNSSKIKSVKYTFALKFVNLSMFEIWVAVHDTQEILFDMLIFVMISAQNSCK